MKTEQEIQKRESYYHLKILQDGIEKELTKLLIRPKDLPKTKWLSRLDELYTQMEILEARIEELRWVLELPNIK